MIRRDFLKAIVGGLTGIVLAKGERVLNALGFTPGGVVPAGFVDNGNIRLPRPGEVILPWYGSGKIPRRKTDHPERLPQGEPVVSVSGIDLGQKDTTVIVTTSIVPSEYAHTIIEVQYFEIDDET